jgi:hypothetical protein
VDLKSFKQGVEYLSRATNQREREPSPFLLQVGKDGLISLVAGNKDGTYLWRTGLAGGSPRREAISSKLLTQATKTLKGKLDMGLSVTDDGLKVTTSAGGSVDLAYGPELPTLVRPPKGEMLSMATLPAERLDQLARAFEVADTSGFYGAVSIVPGEGAYSRLVSSDRYILFQTFIELDTALPETYSTPSSFWSPLRGARSDATLFILESGLRVRSGQFEAFTGLSDYRPDFVDYKDTYFPEGSQPDTTCVLDRKVLIGSIKALNDEWVFIERTEGGVVTVNGRTSGQSIGITEKKGRGAARPRSIHATI